MAKYQKYSEYKESGVEWLGDIPSHWTATVLKRYTRITDGSHHSPKIESEGFPFVSVTDVGINNINFVDAKKIAESDYSRLVKEGCKPAVNDVLLTKDGTIGRACIVTAEMPDFVILSSLGLITPSKAVSSQFLYYYLVSGINVDQMNSVIHGSALKRMTINKINDLIFTFPIFYEQEKIANFLDYETAKIDTLIAKQQKLIELLKEKRQAVISHTVTKGLNPDVPMKDSGVEWLGKVPEHWGVSLIKYQCREITDGAHISPELENGEYLFVSIRDIKEGVINFDDALLTSEKSYQYLVHTGCMPFEGDILFSKDGTIGQTAITPPNVDFVVASSLIIIRPQFHKVIPEFLDLLLRSDVVQEQVESFVKGAALRRLSIQNLLKIWGVFPSLTEQKELVGFVQLQLEKYKVLEVQAERQVELLRERRTALISAAVTGKIDVRNWQNPIKNNNQDNMELSA